MDKGVPMDSWVRAGALYAGPGVVAVAMAVALAKVFGLLAMVVAFGRTPMDTHGPQSSLMMM